VASILLGTASPDHLLAVARALEDGPPPAPMLAAIREAQARVGSGWAGRI
jgi:hypothetical protein